MIPCRAFSTLACMDSDWPTIEAYEDTESDPGACSLDVVSITPRYTVWLPQWTSPSMVDPETLTWWRQVARDLRDHETHHVVIAREFLPELTTDLQGAPCAEYDAVETAWADRGSVIQDAFDEAEGAMDYPPYERNSPRISDPHGASDRPINGHAAAERYDRHAP